MSNNEKKNDFTVFENYSKHQIYVIEKMCVFVGAGSIIFLIIFQTIYNYCYQTVCFESRDIQREM